MLSKHLKDCLNLRVNAMDGETDREKDRRR